jgi:hypothetical protein
MILLSLIQILFIVSTTYYRAYRDRLYLMRDLLCDLALFLLCVLSAVQNRLLNIYEKESYGHAIVALCLVPLSINLLVLLIQQIRVARICHKKYRLWRQFASNTNRLTGG